MEIILILKASTNIVFNTVKPLCIEVLYWFLSLANYFLSCFTRYSSYETRGVLICLSNLKIRRDNKYREY